MGVGGTVLPNSTWRSESFPRRLAKHVITLGRLVTGVVSASCTGNCIFFKILLDSAWIFSRVAGSAICFEAAEISPQQQARLTAWD